MITMQKIKFVSITVFVFVVYFLITPSFTIHNRNTYNSPPNSSWELSGYALIIDDSDPLKDWENYTQSNPQWCAGSGVPGDPYVIFSLNIDALQKDKGIYIVNSEAPFLLFECDVVNVGNQYNTFGTGICFENVSNGDIVRCEANSNSWSGISLFNCQDVRISETSISDNSVYGIEIFQSFNIQIDLNEIINNSYNGIYMHRSNYSIIEDNRIEYHEDGLLLAGCSDNIVKGNEICYNTQDAIELNYKCDRNSITSNLLHDNTHGVYIIRNSHDNAISNNYFSGNTYDIAIGDSCHGTVIVDNGDCNIYSVDDTTNPSPPPDDDPDSPDNADPLDDTKISISGYNFLFLLISTIGTLLVYWFKKRHIATIEAKSKFCRSIFSFKFQGEYQVFYLKRFKYFRGFTFS